MKLEGESKEWLKYFYKASLTTEQLLGMTKQELWEHELDCDVEHMRIEIKYAKKGEGINEKTKDNSSRLRT